MALTYHFEFRAEAATPAGTLEDFLKCTEGEAKLLGFAPTTVVNGPFDTVAQREFSRRVAPPLPIEDIRLKGADLAKDLA